MLEVTNCEFRRHFTGHRLSSDAGGAPTRQGGVPVSVIKPPDHEAAVVAAHPRKAVGVWELPLFPSVDDRSSKHGQTFHG
jgi:hypothetical protein